MQPNTAAFHFGEPPIADQLTVSSGYPVSECPQNLSGEVVGYDSSSNYSPLSGGGKRKRRSKYNRKKKTNRKRKTNRKKSNRKRKSNSKRKSNRK